MQSDTAPTRSAAESTLHTAEIRYKHDMRAHDRLLRGVENLGPDALDPSARVDHQRVLYIARSRRSHSKATWCIAPPRTSCTPHTPQAGFRAFFPRNTPRYIADTQCLKPEQMAIDVAHGGPAEMRSGKQTQR